MKFKIIRTTFLFVIISLLVNYKNLYAQQGDTTFIQTFEFEGYPPMPGWNSPKQGFFDFSAIDGKTFNKVLMYYTLKCDNTQSPACGEWDYLTHAKVMEHTGRGEDPNFNIGGPSGYTVDNISFMNDVSWNYKSRFEKSIIWDNPTEVSTYQIGTGTVPMTISNSDGRYIFLFTKDELSAAGLMAGNITGLQLDFANATNETLKNLTIRIKHASVNQLSNNVDTTGFTTVYAKNTKINSTGWHAFDFYKFFNWNGTSNILVDVYYSIENENSQYTLNCTKYIRNVTTNAESDDYFFYFEGADVIPVRKENFTGITNEITISFWQYGDPEIQPQSDYIFEAKNATGDRVLNVHLPWDNGSVYWDAGNETGYDRIEKPMTPEQYKGRWNHWAFTKNVNEGTMKMYLNGELFHSETGKLRTIDVIDTMVIGKGLSVTNPRHYDGAIDEFRVWNKELDQATIQHYMKREINYVHPNYYNLKLYYKFNEANGYTTKEETSGYNSKLWGIPQRKSFNGKRFKNFSSTIRRPNVKFNRNTSNFTLTSELVVDSFPKGQIMIEKYIQTDPDVKPVLDETLYVYPTYYNNYTYDSAGNAIDSVLVSPDETLELEMIGYNTSDPADEILIPWEIGRFITPYGGGLDLGEEGWTWIYDVTDFQHLLRGDNVEIRAGNFQELLDMKFAFIEGTPPRDLIEIKNVYSGNYLLDTFDEEVVPKTMSLNSEAKMYSVKTTVTGHDFGEGNNCGEFCPNTHSVTVNGTTAKSWEIITECGENPLFPQGGTWFYDRAGWCPGMPAVTQNIDITPYISDTDTEVDIDYDITHDPYGNYVTEIFLVQYGDYNFVNNASLEEIISPSNFNLNKRFNPMCGKSRIKIKNNGAAPLTSLHIDYGIYNNENATYEWTGNLEFNEEEVIILPPLGYMNYLNNSNQFYVEISEPNGEADEYEYDNSKVSSFEIVPSYPPELVFRLRTNSRPQQNRYEIYDIEGNSIFSNELEQANTVYSDTLTFQKGCYEFVIYDTQGNGMNNWPEGDGNGAILIHDKQGPLLKFMERWFGHSLRQSFAVEADVAVPEIAKSDFNIWPNPSKGSFHFRLQDLNSNKFYLTVYSLTGKTLFSKQYTKENTSAYNLDLSALPAGIFSVKIIAGTKTYHQKIIIQ